MYIMMKTVILSRALSLVGNWGKRKAKPCNNVGDNIFIEKLLSMKAKPEDHNMKDIHTSREET